MKALVYTQPNEVQLHDRPEPELVDGEVVLRIDATGICGSDMHAHHGHDPRRQPGLVLGHEFAATVLQSATPLWAVGSRVTGNPLITCGRCDFCLQGRDNLCSDRSMVGMSRPGSFAQRMSIPGRCPSAGCWSSAVAPSACWPRCCCATMAWTICRWPRCMKAAARHCSAMPAAPRLTPASRPCPKTASTTSSTRWAAPSPEGRRWLRPSRAVC